MNIRESRAWEAGFVAGLGLAMVVAVAGVLFLRAMGV